MLKWNLKGSGHSAAAFKKTWEFPGSPVVRTQHFHCQGLSLIPDRGTKSPLAAKLDHNNNNVAYLVDRLNMNMCNPLLF